MPLRILAATSMYAIPPSSRHPVVYMYVCVILMQITFPVFELQLVGTCVWVYAGCTNTGTDICSPPWNILHTHMYIAKKYSTILL